MINNLDLESEQKPFVKVIEEKKVVKKTIQKKPKEASKPKVAERPIKVIEPI